MQNANDQVLRKTASDYKPLELEHAELDRLHSSQPARVQMQSSRHRWLDGTPDTPENCAISHNKINSYPLFHHS
ncbi:hypothetical protein PGT21_021268 [Puccinia graminis f. sp. tritici]|uniref:Uncharacterized protein n=1 Tax=Puccinia graminis f. sp. tritici TaxID=56615 RepID=A0A5B0SA39_PUCGR|nr:hypothetical protein PGT21_021268 [Puccinia graminis f. sp. tritici]KAA1134677.1 hypothetical protein PGTUg99_012802 [Puccinia graminis f. sp. tritici]